MVRLRKPLPPYALKTPEGARSTYRTSRGSPSSSSGARPWPRAWRRGRRSSRPLEAQAYLLAQAPRPSPLPLLLDPEGALLGAIPEGGVLVADAFLEVYHLGPVRDEEEVLEWLRFVEAQCPECVLPEADWL